MICIARAGQSRFLTRRPRVAKSPNRNMLALSVPVLTRSLRGLAMAVARAAPFPSLILGTQDLRSCTETIQPISGAKALPNI